MDIEKEIENIVNNIHHKEIISFSEIEEIRNIVVDKAYEEFMIYPDNEQTLVKLSFDFFDKQVCH